MVTACNSETVYYIDADGGWFPLHDGVNYIVGLGESGRFTQDYNIVSESVYAMDGDILRAISTATGEIEIPITVRGSTETEFLEKMRLLRYATNPKRGQGHLRYEMVDGTIRHLKCHLSDMPVAETADKGGGGYWRSFVATFTSHDPDWYNPIETEKLWSDPTGALSYVQVIHNEGDQESWPIWDIRGPMLTAYIFNETTVKALYITYTLDEYEHIYIDTRPGRKSMLFGHTTNVAKYRATTSELFPIVPGENRMSFQFSQTSYSANAWVKCRWVDRYGGV